MGLPHCAVGAALGVILWGLLPTMAAADGRTAPRPASMVAHQQDVGRSAVPVHPQLVDLPNPRGRIDRSALDRQRDERERLRLAIQKLRQRVHVAVQRPACHPRGKPPHHPFGYADAGYWPGSDFDDDDWGNDAGRRRGSPGQHGHHPGHGHPGGHGQHGHKPPFCPSPH
jgi:hypothetical protein